MSSSKPIVLVTGATGTTGQEMAKQLIATNKYHVRAGVRTPSKANHLQQLGAEVVQMTDTDVDTALHGVTAIYMVIPAGLAGGAGIETKVFDSYMHGIIKAGTVKHIVYLSALGVFADSPMHGSRRHYQREQAIIKSGILYTMLRPTYFHQNYSKFQMMSIMKADQMVGSGGDGRFTSVDARDIAAVAVIALGDVSTHGGKIYNLTQGVYNMPEVAAEMSKVAGRQIKYTNMTPDDHRAMLVKYGLGEETVNDMAILERAKREEYLIEVAPDLVDVLGRPGITMQQYFADHAALFKK